MPKLQIFSDGRAAGAAPISGSDFTTKDYVDSQSVNVSEPEMDEIFNYTRDAVVLDRDMHHDNGIYLTFAS